MLKPLLELKNYPEGYADILRKFEADQPLSCEQLNFLQRHEKALSNSIIDPVIKYYLTQHRRQPHKALPLELPQQNLSKEGFQQVKHNVHLLLSNHLSHVDLQMSPEQFVKFKALGLHEIVYWHGNSFIPGTIFHHGGAPHRLYFQWGRLFGVIKFHVLSCGKTIEGKVIIYLENRQEKTLQECIKAYTRQLKEQEEYDNNLRLIQAPKLEPVASTFKLPTPSPMPNFMNEFPEENA